MVSCAGCKTPNTLDSAFCRGCGIAIAPDVLAGAREELARLVEKGAAAYEDGRIEDAAAIAEEAVRADPTSAMAWALAGSVHERRGEVAKALEAYERVVDLNPDSPLDRLKLAGLRSAIADRATARPDRRTPMLAGASAAVLLACVGIGAYKLSSRAPSVPASGLVASASSAEESGVPAGLITDGRAVGTMPVNNGLSTTLEPGDVAPLGANNPGGEGAGVPDPNVGASASSGLGGYNARRGRGLPAARRDAPPTLEGSLPPMMITPSGAVPGGTVPGGTVPGGAPGTLPNPAGGSSYPGSASTKAAPSPKVDPDPTPQGGGSSGSSPSSDPRPKAQSPGLIDIQVTGGGSSPAKTTTRASGSSGGSAGGNGAEALTRVGNAHMTGGDSARAAKAYEGALRAGADSGAVNQRLGQAYERMGRKAEAAQAYARAASAYRERIASGQGGDRAKNGLDSVNQALKVLGRG